MLRSHDSAYIGKFHDFHDMSVRVTHMLETSMLFLKVFRICMSFAYRPLQFNSHLCQISIVTAAGFKNIKKTSIFTFIDPVKVPIHYNRMHVTDPPKKRTLDLA